MQDLARKTLDVQSTAFRSGEMIPSEFTADGENISPDLFWEGAPPGVHSYAILVEDPDIPIPRFIIPVWFHWAVYNISPETNSIPTAFMRNGSAGNGSMMGITSYRKQHYSGPCPPFGTHRYYFRVYALDTRLNVDPKKATRKKLHKAMNGHILAWGELMGTYKRQR